jgi:cystine transport system permease protein
VGGGALHQHELEPVAAPHHSATGARVAVPPLSNTFISLVKDTSLASVITVPEMFLAAQRIAAVTYQPLILYTEAALLYLLISSVLSYLQSQLETRLERNTVAKENNNDNAIRT